MVMMVMYRGLIDFVCRRIKTIERKSLTYSEYKEKGIGFNLRKTENAP